MTMNPLPPQAYTKETLVKAYQWLQHQGDGIKEMASNPDILVSLYLKAKTQGDSALERPSIQNFKNELKNLAGLMGEFESPGPQASLGTVAALNQRYSAIPQQTLSNSHSTSAAGASATSLTSSSSFLPPPTLNPEPATSLPQQEQTALRKMIPELDTRSWLMIQEVKNQTNLSSDLEALRLLISVGHSKLKSLMKDS